MARREQDNADTLLWDAAANLQSQGKVGDICNLLSVELDPRQTYVIPGTRKGLVGGCGQHLPTTPCPSQQHAPDLLACASARSTSIGLDDRRGWVKPTALCDTHTTATPFTHTNTLTHTPCCLLQFDEALEKYTNVSTVLAKMYFNIGTIRMSQGKHADAIEAYSQVCHNLALPL